MLLKINLCKKKINKRKFDYKRGKQLFILHIYV